MSLQIGGRKIRAAIFTVCMLCGMFTFAAAQVSIGIGLPSVRIGINIPVYPNLIPVPGYPVYYDPRLDSNLFFYDGLYWVYAQDTWYASTWYDGPWDLISAETVPDFLLRIPVLYYRRPPAYFYGWDREAPPRWGEHWGREWDDRRRGWDHWDRASIPRRAPLPGYQREYSRDRYPRVDQQHALRDRNYHYRPREEVARRQFGPPPQREHQPNRAPAAHQRPNAPPTNIPRANAPPARANAPPAADRPPAGERRKSPPPPGKDTTGAPRAQPDRRAPQQRPAERNAPRRDSQPPSPRTDTPPG